MSCVSQLLAIERQLSSWQVYVRVLAGSSFVFVHTIFCNPAAVVLSGRSIVS